MFHYFPRPPKKTSISTKFDANKTTKTTKSKTKTKVTTTGRKTKVTQSKSIAKPPKKPRKPKHGPNSSYKTSLDRKLDVAEVPCPAKKRSPLLSEVFCFSFL